jgi:Tfp pilus tip-associated adhesin PilY1
MNRRWKSRTFSLAATALLAFTSFQASPEDIDIFSVDESNLVARPNVLIVLDNSANWARASQQWPGNEQQGQAEASALKTVITDLSETVNVGLIEHITGGTSNDADSAYVRYHLRPMSGSINDRTTNKGALGAVLDKIYVDVNTPEEKRSQGNPFGNLFWDVYNYLSSSPHSNEGAGTLARLADASAYSKLFSVFQSPLTAADSCTRTIVIFIGNNVSVGPTKDSDTNVKALYNLAGGGESGTAAITQIPFADYVVTTKEAVASLGYTDACYSGNTACTTAVNTAACTDQGFSSCFCDANDSLACPNAHWSVVGTQVDTVTEVLKGPDTFQTPNASTGDIIQTCKTDGQAANLNPTNCPAPTDFTTTDPNDPTIKTRTETSWSDCAYVDVGTTGCSGSKANYEKHGTKTETVTVTQDFTETTTKVLGETSACYSDAPNCSTEDFASDCSSFNRGCACVAETGDAGCAPPSTARYQAKGNYTIISASQTGTFSEPPPGPFMMDEWARFLRQTGVPVPGTTDVRTQVTTYTIDVFNAQQHPDFSALLFNAARVGGGKYYQARDKNALIQALREILTEVQAVNSAFSSASLPVNATNRAQNENQVFIGVFKPDRLKRPDWFGNLKRYQLISSGSTIDLGDANGNRAINPQTGFITDCAVSFWTTDSGNYWQTPLTTEPVPLGQCTTNTTSDLSDLPDGPFVEKGAVSEVLRKGNSTTATPDADGNYTVNRKVYTVTAATAANTTPPEFDAATSGLDDKLVLFTRGHDIRDEDIDQNQTEPRSTIHGDVVHSRPQPLNFGGSTGVVVFYGSNDGHYRAVKAETGVELWSFIAPEHFGKLQRLFANNPNNRFHGDQAIGTEPKDYFFDGSTGVYQVFNTDGTSKTAYIYPTMRRGGRKIYAFNVSDPANPRYMWSKGCASNDNATCDAGFTAIGQTWPVPNVATLAGYCGSGGCIDADTPRLPVIVLGGGYDQCDDQNTATPCAATRGRGVYVIDATNGSLIKYFDFSSFAGARGVAADVALIDVNNDAMVDYGYAVDTGGNVYRMDFIDGPTTLQPLDSSAWTATQVAYTKQASDPRKFLFPPALVQATASTVYLALGSGDREHPLMSQYPFGTLGDPASAILNRFYVFKDNVGDDDGDPVTADVPLNLDDATLMADYTDANSCGTPPILPSSSLRGWFIDLDEHGQGEQTVTSAVVAAGFVFFSTNRPTSTETTTCTTSLGEARGYFVNLLNGSGAVGVAGACGGERSSTFVGGGLPPSPVLATVPVDGQLRTVVIGAVQKTGEPSSPIEAQRVRPPIASDRKPIYWYKSSGDK